MVVSMAGMLGGPAAHLFGRGAGEVSPDLARWARVDRVELSAMETVREPATFHEPLLPCVCSCTLTLAILFESCGLKSTVQ